MSKKACTREIASLVWGFGAAGFMGFELRFRGLPGMGVRFMGL